MHSKRMIYPLAAAWVCLILFSGCSSGAEKARKSVEEYLDAVARLDFSAAQEFLAEDGTQPALSPADGVSDYGQAILPQLTYEVLGAEAKGAECRVTVRISTVDAAAALQAARQGQAADQGPDEIKTRMITELQRQDAPRTQAEIVIHLEKDRGVWKLLSSEEFVNAMLGGFYHAFS